MPMLAYWNIRGLGQPIRLLLAYLDVEYEDKRYEYEMGGDIKTMMGQWLREKFTLGLDFPNVPYYIDGDVKISQSMAIMKYICRKYGLEGKTEDEIRNCDVGTEIAVELHQDIFCILLLPDSEEMFKTMFTKGIEVKAKQVDAFLTGKYWVAGSNITIADFRLYETFQAIIHFKATKGFLDGLPAVNDFIQRFEALPNIKRYMESSEFVSWPYTGPFFEEKFEK